MNKNKLRMMLIKLGLIIFMVVGLFTVGTKLGNMSNPKTVMASSISNTYSVSDTIKTKEVNVAEKVVKVESKGKILLYNSHGNEKNVDSTIAEITSDLKLKLEKKGYIVEQNLENFATKNGYNKSYQSSGTFLEKLDLSQYELILDCHMDSTPNPVVADFKSGSVAKLMFPNVSENPNLKHQTELVEKIKDGLNTFSDKIYRNQTTAYRVGIQYYNLNRNPNMLLVEIGSDKNNFFECRKTCTLLVSAIERALEK